MNLFVYTELAGQTVYVGQLFVENRHRRLASAFAYDTAYMSNPKAYPIDPTLPLVSGTWPVSSGLPRSFLDAAPDRWGRNLINRRTALEAAEKRVSPRTLSELDYLLGVSDVSRQGALRFRVTQDGDFEHPATNVPRLVDLPALLSATRRVANDNEPALDAVKMLLDVGSASLGGARPKASVMDGTRLTVAKFPHPQDRWNVIAWEMTALDLAEAAGVSVPERRLEMVGGSPVLLTERFDRTDKGNRRGYISAMTLCEATEGDLGDYLDIAERLATMSGSAHEDLVQLWRRVVLGIAINNTDDHLRNHGLLRTNRGWRLSPAFDLNPDPHMAAAHTTSIGGVVHGEDTVAVLSSTVQCFGVSVDLAMKIVRDVIDSVKQWDRVAARNGISRSERTRFSPVFHQGVSTLEASLDSLGG